MKIFKFQELFENIAVHKNVRIEKLPYCNNLQNKGFRIAQINGESYAFTKNYEADDEVYWLGVTDTEYEYGRKYIATFELVSSKDNLPFYCLYSKCDPSLTPEQVKIRDQRDKEIVKLREQRKRELEKMRELKKKKKKK